MNIKMKKSTAGALALAIGALLLSFPAAPSASATTVTECKALIDSLISETQAVTITGQNADKDRAGLLGKLSNAEIKLDQAKFSDAIQKLNDYIAKVEQLIAAGHISQTDGNTLISGANDAIQCIRTL
jgi:hypothetical protein